MQNLLNAGHLRPCISIVKQLEEFFAAHSQVNLSRQKAKFERLNSAVQELKNWQDSIAKPKREELCNKMQILAEDMQMDLKIKADKIKLLQNEWKSLGANGQDDELWKEFKRQADFAYAPCKENFQQDKYLKKQNLLQKNIICTELEYLAEQDIVNLSTKDYYRIIGEAKKQWREYSPVNNRDYAKIHPRYIEVLNKLQKQRDLINKEIRSQKLSILDEARDLLENASAHFNDFKKLRQKWWQLDELPRKEEKQKYEILNSRIESFLAKNQAMREEQIKLQAEQEHKASSCIKKLSTDLDASKIDEFMQEFKTLQDLLSQVSDKFYRVHKQEIEQIKQRQKKLLLWLDFKADKNFIAKSATKYTLSADEIIQRLELILGASEKSQDEIFKLQLERLQHRKNLHIQDDLSEVELLICLWQADKTSSAEQAEKFSENLKNYCLARIDD